MSSFNISAYSIRQPVPSIVLFIVLCFLGWMSYNSLPITRFPNIDVPLIQVRVVQAGAAPAELESQIAKRVEDAVASITGVKRVISNLTDGQSSTVVEFRLEVNTDRALNDVKDAIAKIRADLPRGIEEPIIERLDIENQAILTVAVAAPSMSLEQLSWFVDDTVKRELQGLRGIGRISRNGGVLREIRVALDPNRLMALGITAGDVNRQLRATNVDLAGGRGDIGGQQQSIRTLAGAQTVDELAATKIVLPGGREVRLSDLGTVTDLYEEPKSFTRLNGETPTVAFQVFRSKGASDVRVAALARAKIDELRAANPAIAFTEIDNSVNYTAGNHTSAMTMLMEGALLTVIVVFLFLRDFRATIISAVALPLSIDPHLLGDRDAGLLDEPRLAAGDHAGHRHPRRRRDRRDREHRPAHARWANRPIKRRHGGRRRDRPRRHRHLADHRRGFRAGVLHGRHRRPVFQAVRPRRRHQRCCSRSWWRASITPMLAAYFLRPHAHREEKDGLLMRTYLRFLSGTIRFRYLTLLAGIGIFALSIWAVRFLPTGFIPFPDEARFVISMPNCRRAPTWTTPRERTDRLAQADPREGSRGRIRPRHRRVESDSAPSRCAAPPSSSAQPQADCCCRTAAPDPAGDVADSSRQIPDIRAWYVNDRGERELSIIVHAAPTSGTCRLRWRSSRPRCARSPAS